MARNRGIVNLGLIGLLVGGVGSLLVLLFTFTSTSLRPTTPSAGTPASDQGVEALSLQQILETTYLGHPSEIPDPGEPVAVLRKYLKRDTHKYLDDDNIHDLDQEIAEWEILVQEHFQSRHALAGLAGLYRRKGELTQEARWFRSAADLYVKAAEIGLEHGRIRYTRELSELLVELDDKAGLDEIFSDILAQPRDDNRSYYYGALVDYADGLVRLNDEQRAWYYFEDAVDFHPEQNVEAINRYARHLLDRGYTQQALDVLDSQLTSEARAIYVMPALLRKEARESLGLDTASTDMEVNMVRQRVIENGGSTSIFFDLPSTAMTKEFTGGLARLQSLLSIPAAEAQPWAHSVQNDDCRDTDWTAAVNFCDPNGGCFTPNAVNLAEIIYNEARGETQGARYTVGWTVKNRAFQALSPLCDIYIGAMAWGNLSQCFNGIPCNDPNFCEESKRVCCVMHGGTTQTNDNHFQFNDSHVPFNDLLTSGTIYAAFYVLDGLIPDMSTGWIPPGVSGCNDLDSANACGPVGISVDSNGFPVDPASAGPWCEFGANFFDPNPNGPMEYLGFMYTPTADSCKWPSGFVCAGAGPGDNYFWNRKGPSSADPIGAFDGIFTAFGLPLSAWGWALDSDTPLAPIDIEIYADGDINSGTLVAEVIANEPRQDVNDALGIPGDHGFR